MAQVRIRALTPDTIVRLKGKHARWTVRRPRLFQSGLAYEIAPEGQPAPVRVVRPGQITVVRRRGETR